MNSGGAGACRSRGRREARPNPVSRTCPSAQFTRRWAGFRSLCTRPRAWSLPREAAMPTAKGRKLPTAMGVPSSRSSGSPPGSSSMSMLLPLALKRQGPRRPRPIQHVLQAVFVGQAIEATRAGMLRGGHHGQHGAPFAAIRLTPGSAENALAVRPQDLEAAISLWAKTRHRLICRTPPASWLSPSDSEPAPIYHSQAGMTMPFLVPRRPPRQQKRFFKEVPRSKVIRIVRFTSRVRPGSLWNTL